MLRSVLPLGGSPTHQRTDTNSKLLELADRDAIEDGPTGTETTSQDDADEERGLAQPAPPPADSAIASVVTQVTHVNPNAASEPPRSEDVDGRTSWRSKFRSILCCLAPSPSSSSSQYGSRSDDGPAVLRPPPLTHLPHWPQPVIGPPAPGDAGRKCLILDLDETLVHSSFRPVPNPDYVIPVEIEGRVVDVYVIKRPYVDHFLRTVGQRFEVVVFTASLGKYADPLLDLLDSSKIIRWRLFREACYPYEGSYVKDLQCMGRDAGQMIIVDNSPHSYAFQPENAVPIGTFIDDMEDSELLECLETLLAVEEAEDVRPALADVLARRDAGLPLTKLDGNAAIADGR